MNKKEETKINELIEVYKEEREKAKEEFKKAYKNSDKEALCYYSAIFACLSDIITELTNLKEGKIK